MRRRKILLTCALLLATALAVHSRSANSQSGPPAPSPTAYNPYPPGLLPQDLDSETARVLREIDVIEGIAIERWHSLPPPTPVGVRPGPNPPVLKGTGTESIETLGELMLFDKRMSPGRNQACTSCHMPYAGWSGPIPSVNLTIIAYPGTVHYRAGKRTAQRHTYAPFFPVLQYNQEQMLFLGGNFWDSRATGYSYGIPTPSRPRVRPLILKKWASLITLAWRFGFRRLFTVLSSN
jgi:cytochrome c peroxidase